MSVRYAHTDVTVPSFDDYRIKSTSNQAITDFRKREDDRRLDQKSFYYAVTGTYLEIFRLGMVSILM